MLICVDARTIICFKQKGESIMRKIHKNIVVIDNYLRVLVVKENNKIRLPSCNVTIPAHFVCGEKHYAYVTDKQYSFKIINSSFIAINIALQSFAFEEDRQALLYFMFHIKDFEQDDITLESFDFVKALEKMDIQALSKISKSDLHNHTPFGGSRELIRELSGKEIPILDRHFKSIPEMNKWCDDNIKAPNDYQYRMYACFKQAEQDGIKVFAPNIATCAKKNFPSLDCFINFINELIQDFSDSMDIYPELALDRNKYSEDLKDLVIKLLDTGMFYSIDITGDEALGVQNFKEIYDIASSYGIIKKAHVGEFSHANAIFDAIKTLDLDAVHHGISAIEDERLMDYLVKHKISLTMCPSSNYFLSRVCSIANHPIKQLYHYGVGVSVCSDDILIFGSSVSNEYKILYENKVLNAFELNAIRLDGLNFYAK